MPKSNWGSGATGAVTGAATGAAVGSAVPVIGTGVGAVVGGLVGGMSGLWGGGKKPKIKPVSTLRPEQEPLYNQAVNAGMGEGAGGAFGDSADYYRNLLSDNSADYNAFAAPALRQYNEDIVPGISEQFAGMGAGGLSSSGFRNAQIQGGVDLSERLGALRASLRQSGAQGLTNIGQIGLGKYSENVMNEPQPGFGQGIAEGVGKAIPDIASAYISNKLNAPAAPTAKAGANSYGSTKVGVNSSPYNSNDWSSSPSIPSSNWLKYKTGS